MTTRSTRNSGRTNRSKTSTPVSSPTASKRSARTAGRGGSKQKGSAEVSDDESRESRVSGVSVGSSTTSLRERLPRWVEKKLAEDIEEYGLKNVGPGAKKKKSLAAILNEGDPRAYGGPQSDFRAKLGQKVNKWKKLPRDKYLLKLAKLDVAPFEAKKTSASYRETKSECDLSSSGSEDETEDQGIPDFIQTVQSPKTPTKSKQKKGNRALLTSPLNIPPSTLEESETEPSPNMSKNPHRSGLEIDPTIPHPYGTNSKFCVDCCVRSATPFLMPANVLGSRFTVDIGVDIKRPENNREFQIYSVLNFKGAGKAQRGNTFAGYGIVLPMDIQWVKRNLPEDSYKARVLSANKIMITVPAWDYTQLFGVKPWDEAEHCDEQLVGGMQNARNNIDDEKGDRKWKTFVLHFPDGHKLSSKEIYLSAGQDEILSCDFVKVVSNTKKNIFRYYAVWKVARVDVSAYKLQKKNKTKKEMSEAEKKLAKLGLNESDLEVDEDKEEEEQEEGEEGEEGEGMDEEY